MTVRLSLPDQRTEARFTDLPTWSSWSGTSPARCPVVARSTSPSGRTSSQGDLTLLDPERVRAVQSQTLGYDDAVGHVPDGITWCNAVGVHEGPAAEIAVGLLIAALRGFDEFARAMPEGNWVRAWHPGVLGSRVLLLGYGGIGTEVHARLDGFGVELLRVARTARSDEHGEIHGIDELPSLLPLVDAVVVAVPYGPDTHHLVDDDLPVGDEARRAGRQRRAGQGRRHRRARAAGRHRPHPGRVGRLGPRAASARPPALDHTRRVHLAARRRRGDHHA